ncbi:MAG: hypothetical protein HY714_00765 [Candidatus Omnitrophica bacterium]|nr:hypothetical protein [Candidatus Omnitrophota bacterium]
MKCGNLVRSIQTLSRGEKGFTYLELLASVALFVTFTIFLLNAFNLGHLAIADLDTVNLAHYLAGNKMEQTRSLSYGSIISEGRTAVSGFPEYESQVDVSFPQTPNTNLKKVIVTIFYNKGGSSNSVWLKTYIVNNA